MAENGSPRTHSLEQLLLAGVGWISITAETIEEMADDLAHRVGVAPEKMREAVRDTFASWKQEGERVTAVPSEATDKALRRLGLVRREEMEDASLRIAQLEHRVRLLEKSGAPDASADDAPAG